MRAAARSPARDADPVASVGVSLWVRLLESHNLMLAELRRRMADECTIARFDLLVNLHREDVLGTEAPRTRHPGMLI